MIWLIRFLTLAVFSGIIFSAESRSQTVQPTAKPVNFSYSRNPKTKNKPVEQKNKNQTIPPAVSENEKDITGTRNKTKNLISENKTEQAAEFENYSSASKTLEIATRAANSITPSPTEIYKIGVGDVLFISIQNAASKASTYFTVLNDGTIDYPLASRLVAVAGLTTEEIEESLKEKVKLYVNSQISVKVREHSSHSITVLGLVEKSGEKFLQREAMPLYVVKADAVVQAKANQLVIKRVSGATENLDLKDSKNENALIFPGDILEFKSTESIPKNLSASRFYFIGGEIKSAGQKDFYTGISLTQAILASGGLRKPFIKRVVIRRKNEQGLLSPIEFDLNAIKDGKQPDPILQAGDTIEIVKY